MWADTAQTYTLHYDITYNSFKTFLFKMTNVYSLERDLIPDKNHDVIETYTVFVSYIIYII